MSKLWLFLCNPIIAGGFEDSIWKAEHENMLDSAIKHRVETRVQDVQLLDDLRGGMVTILSISQYT